MANNSKELIGVLTEAEVKQYFILYSLSQRTSLSKVIEGILCNWVKSGIKNRKEEQLVVKIQENLQREWTIEKSRHGVNGFKSFITSKEKYFLQKGLSPQNIKTILNIVK